MRIATVSEVPTPWLCLQEDLRQAGVDPARLDRITDRSMAENLNALTEGWIEAAQFFEPVVEEALASSKGHLWYAASARGRTSYTAFVTTRRAGSLAISDPYCAWSEQSSGHSNGSILSLRRRLSRPFPRSSQRSTSACWPPPSPVTSRSRVWGRDPVLPEDGFDRLRRSLVSGGFIRRPTSCTACADNRLALRVLSE
jgi:NitT/TauT family transport system substrate-binding protein